VLSAFRVATRPAARFASARSFSQGLVCSLANRMPDEQRHILEDLAVLTTKAAARRAECSSATLWQRQEMALGWLFEVLYLQRVEVAGSARFGASVASFLAGIAGFPYRLSTE